MLFRLILYLSRSKVSSVELRYIKFEPAMCWSADLHVFLTISPFSHSPQYTLFAPQHFAKALSLVSLGMTVMPRSDERQRLCRILEGKQGVLGGMWKWRIGWDNEFEKKLGYIFSSSLVLVPSDLWSSPQRAGTASRVLIFEFSFSNPYQIRATRGFGPD